MKNSESIPVLHQSHVCHRGRNDVRIDVYYSHEQYSWMRTPLRHFEVTKNIRHHRAAKKVEKKRKLAGTNLAPPCTYVLNPRKNR